MRQKSEQLELALDSKGETPRLGRGAQPPDRLRVAGECAPAARVLGMARTTLLTKMKRYGIR